MNREYEYVNVINLKMVQDRLPCRYKDSHKGTFGTMLCVSGSRGMVGAGMFPILAALKSGVGIVRAMLVESIYKIIGKDILEPVYIPLEENSEGTISESEIPKIIDNLKKSNSLMIGCGIGLSESTRKIMEEVIKNSDIPLIIDADGINIISENIDILKQAKSDVVLTPHIKEFSRLSGKSIDEINADKTKISCDFAKKYNVTLVLKSSTTLIVDKGENAYLNMTKNSGMAKGGSGDVLAGLIGSFLAQKLSPLDASLCAVYLHGLCGQRCAKNLSETSMLPSDIINELPNIFSEIENKE